MADVNHVTLIGRLTRDADLKYTSSGMAVCKFAIAVNKRRKNGDQWVEEANFFDIVLWGRSGESLNQYLVKGKQIAVEGELRQNRWEQDGQARSKIEIVATNIQLLGGNAGIQNGTGGTIGNNGASPSSGTGDGTYQRRQNVMPNNSVSEADMSVPPADFPDDIPF